MSSKKRLLFVGNRWGLHFSSWIDHIDPSRWEIFYFNTDPDSQEQTKDALFSKQAFRKELQFLKTDSHPNCAKALKSQIQQLRPALIHSTLRAGDAGSLVLNAVTGIRGKLPPWIVTHTGSDFSDYCMKKEGETIKAILKSCQFMLCECTRDIPIARKLGFQGEIPGVLPWLGGYPSSLFQLKAPPPSKRNLILLKGNQTIFGRANVGLKALEMISKDLEGFQIAIHSPYVYSTLYAEFLNQKGPLKIEVLPRLPRQEHIKRYARARIAIGLSTSDGISMSLLEAMAFGAFPIQSNSACTQGWIRPHQSGLLVPPENPKKVAKAILTALTDSQLVDRAFRENRKMISQRLSFARVQNAIEEIYQRVVQVEASPTKKRKRILL